MNQTLVLIEALPPPCSDPRPKSRLASDREVEWSVRLLEDMELTELASPATGFGPDKPDPEINPGPVDEAPSAVQ